MTKQDKIREGIALRMHTRERSLLRVIDETNPCNCMWEELSDYFKGAYLGAASLLMDFLHSQGVVLRVDRELPKVPSCQAAPARQSAYRDSQHDMLGDGFTAWESLIKEV